MEYWYRNAELLRAAKDEYGSLSAAAREIGGADVSTLQLWWRKLGLEKLSQGPAPAPGNQEALRRLYEKVYGIPKSTGIHVDPDFAELAE